MARFTRRARLLKAGEFQAVLKKGKRHSLHPLVAVGLDNTLDVPRIGFAIAKKAVPLATQRNRLKRKIRAQFRINMHRLAAVDIVILARSGCAELSAQELDSRLERLWKRIAASPPGS
ncbi:ribonuclease P protein component [Sinimarinibacterium sp. NLF-5-8]|uniref:ribonuclease P protein component n=1 Tax=Sinimarinibacterium sp. NLF-5-8 TaxID=2698684 RepID=UPI00137C14EB|nr:ribonuclease P protein component [Sinimarinibacterium sp. NLF-5-8]QHS10712.1 ribonuclease P protein component [Sinimarinibacterium sp. NLF-5-8]